ncbi:MAG: IS607 family transposase [Promethearchaeota archaeon]
MKAKEVLNLLRISRVTLSKYVKEGTIEVTTLPNGRYDYNEKSVYKFLNKDLPRKTVAYARVSTKKQKPDLENQVQFIKNYCFQNGIVLNAIYEDIASGMRFKREKLMSLLRELINYKIEKIIISHKDRLSRIGFELFNAFFHEFGAELIVLNELESVSTEQEIFQEIISLLHCYTMSMYSTRRKNFTKKRIKEFQNEINL